MGKGKRAREMRAEETALKKQREVQKKKRQKLMRKWGAVAAVVAVVLVIGLVAGISYSNTVKDSGVKLREAKALTTDNFAIDNAMLTYLFHAQYNAFLEQNKANMSYLDLDTDKSLRHQKYGDGTWFSYFLESSVAEAEEMLTLAEGAVADGITLSDEKKAEIKKNVEAIDLTKYGRGVKAEDVQRLAEIQELASMYSDKMYDGITVSAADIDSHYNKNAKDYQTVSYRVFSFAFSEEEKEGTLTKEQALAKAQKMVTCTTEAEFETMLREELKGEEDAEGYIANSKISNHSYSTSTSADEWLFDAAREVGDTQYVEGESNYTVYLVTEKAHRDETASKNFRKIVFKTSEFDSADAARAKADAVLAEYNKGEKTEDAFVKLVAAYSQDETSRSAGGLEKDVAEGTMTSIINAWLFSGARKTGDTTVIESTSGYNVLYYVGDGERVWQANVREDVTGEKYSALYDQLKEKHKVTINDKTTQKIAA